MFGRYLLLAGFLQLGYTLGVVAEIFLETNEYEWAFVAVMDYLGVPLLSCCQYENKAFCSSIEYVLCLRHFSGSQESRWKNISCRHECLDTIVDANDRSLQYLPYRSVRARPPDRPPQQHNCMCRRWSAYKPSCVSKSGTRE